MAALLQFLLCLLASAVAFAQQSTSIPSWCGKPYQPGYPPYNGAGNLSAPTPSASTLLYVQVAPRHSIYIEGENDGAFIVNAVLSNIHGKPYHNTTATAGSNGTSPFNYLYFTIHLDSNDAPLVQNNVSVNSTGNLFNFALTGLKPRIQAYDIVLYGASDDGSQTYTATTQLFYLPAKTTGSIVKVDNLYGGLLFANNVTNFAFEPVFSFGFYTQYSGFLESGASNIKQYANHGFNSVHPEPTYSDNVTAVLSEMDRIGLYFTYDMRNDYQNSTSVTEQVNAVKDLNYLLNYYSADEPDGNQDPLNATVITYQLLEKLDKYHPVSLVLNCYNYYFQDYAKGADIILEDAYPIGINATYSKWGTECTPDYGDCGCDDCVGDLSDVSNRLDVLNEYQTWLGWYPKPLWAVAQSFFGEGYWSRNPTVAETYAMNSLAINHGAKGITLWFYPTEEELANANGAQAKVFQVNPALSFLTGAQPQRVNVKGHPLLDAAYWRNGDQAMIGVANLQYVDTKKPVTLPLPFTLSGSAISVWGNLSWTAVDGGVQAHSVPALATSLVIFDVVS